MTTYHIALNPAPTMDQILRLRHILNFWGSLHLSSGARIMSVSGVRMKVQTVRFFRRQGNKVIVKRGGRRR